MTAWNVPSTAALLPQSWHSRVLAQIAGANLKLIRMDEAGIPREAHLDFDEALLVVEGQMKLEIDSGVIELKAGDFYVVPAGMPHRVLPGSRGTLFLIDAEPDPATAATALQTTAPN